MYQRTHTIHAYNRYRNYNLFCIIIILYINDCTVPNVISVVVRLCDTLKNINRLPIRYIIFFSTLLNKTFDIFSVIGLYNIERIGSQQEL